MSDTLRRWYNRIDRLFDRGALEEPRDEVREEPAAEPLSARDAFALLLPLVRAHDRRPVLTQVAASESVEPCGRASRWEMAWALPRCRAFASADWALQHDVAGEPRSSRVELRLRPHAPAGGSLRQAVDEGRLLHRQLVGSWRDEMRRRGSLPADFRDSTEVAPRLFGGVLDPADDELSLALERDPGDGHVTWVARGRRHAVRCPAT
ncbi:MAG: hypothetical protein AAF533_07465 [Acidobacteriota bacterium]